MKSLGIFFLITASLMFGAAANDIIILQRNTNNSNEKKNYIPPAPNVLLGVAPDGVTPVKITPGPGVSISGNVITGSGGSGGGAPVNLAGASTLTWGTSYYDTFTGNRTLNFAGTATDGLSTSVSASVTTPITLGFTSSVVVPGNGTPVTTIPVNTGQHFFRWDLVNGVRQFIHTAEVTVNANVGTFGNATHTPVITVNAMGQVTAVTLVATAGGGPPAAPTLVSAFANAGELILNWSAPVSQGAGFNIAHLDIDAATTGSNIGMIYSSGNGTATHSFALLSAVVASEVVNFDFSGVANSLEATTGGADVLAITDFPVTNTTSGGGACTTVVESLETVTVAGLNYWGYDTTTAYFATVFTATETSSRCAIAMDLGKSNAGFDFRFEIWTFDAAANSGDGAPGVLIGASATSDSSGVPPGAILSDWIKVSSLSASLTASVKYCIVARRMSGTPDATNYLRINDAGIADPSHSTIWRSADGVTWTPTDSGNVNALRHRLYK